MKLTYSITTALAGAAFLAACGSPQGGDDTAQLMAGGKPSASSGLATACVVMLNGDPAYAADLLSTGVTAKSFCTCLEATAIDEGGDAEEQTEYIILAINGLRDLNHVDTGTAIDLLEAELQSGSSQHDFTEPELDDLLARLQTVSDDLTDGTCSAS